MISIIIPTYNEGANLEKCIESLSTQSYNNLEIIIIDDGSSEVVVSKAGNVSVYRQNHQGPALARNLGASKAHGKILVFVDADMTFDTDFIKMLVRPIEQGETIGTFTKEEYVSNWKSVWARCWNYYQGIADRRRIPKNYPDESPVFRAILKTEFEKVNGFNSIGFTDDWTLSRKLGKKSTVAKGAICYHHNPDSLYDIYLQARWIGKNEFISGNILRKIYSLIKFSIPVQSIFVFLKLLQYKEIHLILFSLVYSYAIIQSVLFSFFKEPRYK